MPWIVDRTDETATTSSHLFWSENDAAAFIKENAQFKCTHHIARIVRGNEFGADELWQGASNSEKIFHPKTGDLLFESPACW